MRKHYFSGPNRLIDLQISFNRSKSTKSGIQRYCNEDSSFMKYQNGKFT